MSTQKSPPTREQREAAAWLARLGNHSITTDTVREFRAWRDNPANDAAYQEAEAFWEASGRLAADPEIMRLTAAALDRPRGGRWARLARPRVRWSLAIAGLAVAGVTLALVATLTPSYATGPTERRIVQLEDGSRLHLNVDSRVRVRFSKGERRVTLTRGEAFFDVAHDAGRPFLVEADGTRVRAVGTKFDVRDHGDFVQVTLLEGRVRVQPAHRPDAWTLAPNQGLVVPDRGQARQAAVDAAQTTSWTTGRLNFRETPLAEAVAEVDRYGKEKVVVEGEDLRRRLVSGYFDVGDTPSFVKGVSLLFDLQATGPTDGVITLRERAPAGA